MNAPIIALALSFAIPWQTSAQDARLTARLPMSAATAVQAIVDEALASGLPTESLVDKALEGVSKGASEEVILTVLRSHLASLIEARKLLGLTVDSATVMAAGMALRAGIPSNLILLLKDETESASAPVAYSVLADLVALGLPPEPASETVRTARVVGLTDSELEKLVSDIRSDVLGGLRPSVAAEFRLRVAATGR